MIAGIWGEDKTCKTTLALTFPKPLAHMEFDIGGFDRANRNVNDIKIRNWVEQGLIIKEYKDASGQVHRLRYVMPFQQIDPVTTLIRPSKIVTGIKELYYQWLVDFMHLLKDPAIQTIVIDTGTLLWEVCNTCYLQEKQEIQLNPDGSVRQGEKLRVQLTQIEYKEPNIRMRGTVYQAKAHEKHLVMTHHATDVYALMPNRDGTMSTQATGKRKRAGWTPLGDGADIILHTYVGYETSNTNPPVRKVVTKCKVDLAEVKELEGQEFREPTYDKIQTMVKMLRGEV